MADCFNTTQRAQLLLATQRIVLTLCLAVGLNIYGLTQCVPTTTQSGTTFTSDNAVRVFGYNNTGNASASDNQYTSANALAFLFSGNTEYLKITGFNFLMPTTAVICGISMVMEARATGITILATVNDNDIRLVKNGSVTGNNQAKSGNWPSSKRR